MGQSRANPGKPPLRPAQRRQHCLPRRLTLPAERGGRSAYKTASAAAGNPPYPGCRRGFHRCWQLTRARQVGWPHMLSIQRGLRQVPADAARSRAASSRKLHIYSHLNLFAQCRASPRARGCRQDQLRCDPRKRGGGPSRQIRDREVPARPPRESAMIMAHFNASFPVPIRADTSSNCSACRPSQRGLGNTKVPAALKPQPALDPNPVLS